MISISDSSGVIGSVTTDGTYYPNTTEKVSSAEAGSTVTYYLVNVDAQTEVRTKPAGEHIYTGVVSHVHAFTMPQSDIEIAVTHSGPS